jgi:signal transduction histidine kinase
MASIEKETRIGRADFLPATAVFLLGLALAVVAFFVVRGHYQNLDRQQFQRDVAYYGTSFKADVQRHVTSLAAIRAFVLASRSVTRWEFSAFARQILPQNSGFKAVLWLPRIVENQRRTYEAQLEGDGLYGLRIRDLVDQGRLVDAGVRQYYLPITYIEPFDGNGSLLGLDLSESPAYVELFRAAEQTGRVAASAPISRTIIKNAHGPIVLIAFPLGAPSGSRKTVAAPDPAQGFALGILQLKDIIENTISLRTSAVQAEIAYVADIHAAPAMLGEATAYNRTIGQWFGNADFHQTLPFNIAGKHFLLAMRSVGHGSPLSLLYVPLGAALLVITLTVLLAQNMIATINRKRFIERAVVARTAELRAVNLTLSEEIDQRRRAEVEIRIARDKAEHASRAKSAFLSAMSHELRTPLNAIIGFSQILASDKTSAPRSLDYLGEIHDSGVRLLDLINDILDLTHMEAANCGAANEYLHLSDCADAVIAKLRPLAHKSGVLLTSSVPEQLPLLCGDSRRIQKALLHLTSNAVKFSGKNGRAEIAAHADMDGSVTVTVSDNGIGMPPGTQAEILELFSQHEAILTRKHDGVGLGLTFVRRVAELHEVAFHISSARGEGTRVSLTFPAHRVAEGARVA